MTGRQKKTTKRLAWLLTLFLVISAILPQPMQAAVSSQTGQVVMEGIRLSKTSLVMKTGESKTLTVSFLPENTTEQPDVIWSSDDTDVVQVTQDGKTATVTAPEGEGGTAVITVKVGTYTATCRVLVTVQEPMLESMVFMQNSSGSNRYELTEATEGVREYTLRVPESTNVVFVRPQLRDDAQNAQITARFTDVTSGQEVAVNLPSDEVTSLTSASTGRLLKAYNIEPKDLVIEVKDGENQENYHIQVVRGTYLGGFTLTDDEGTKLAYTPAFDKRTFQYSLHVSSSRKQIHLSMTGAEKTSTCLTVNGEAAEDGAYTVDIADRTDGQIRLVLQAGDGTLSSPYEYVVTVYVDEICYVSVHTEPADAVVSIYDADKVKIDPKNGTFELIKGATYSYTVSAPGYQSQSGTFKVKDNETKQITLKKGSDSQQEQLNAEWGSYWKTEDNQNILEAQTPESLSGAEVKWKKQYGTYGDYTNSISDGILVEQYICSFQGQYLYYLDRNTGETVKSVKMRGKGNSAFTKPLYADGMIFVPLVNGRIQAFRAKDLESLWLYTDVIGGNTATALRYDSGYLYAGFADGNLVCLNAADENVDQKDEDKTPIWRKYDSGGYYRSGVYTGETYLYACGRSGSLYCLNKKTGETVQTIALSSELGAPSSAISYASGSIYFSTENGYVCAYPLTENGLPDTEHAQQIRLDDTICGTPLIYQGRLYVGSAGKDSYGTIHSPYHLNVVDIGKDGTLSLAYQMNVSGFPKGSGTLTTAYEEQTGYVYVYFTTDSTNGSIYLLKDKAGLTSPGEGSGLLYQQSEVYGNGSGTVLADKNGNLYVRYESGWMYAIKSSSLYLENVIISDGNAVVDDGGAFDGQAENHTVILDAGTSEVTMKFEVSDGTLVTVNGKEGAEQKIRLVDGKAELSVMLGREGQTRTYRFSIHTKSSDTSLSQLQVSFSTIVNVFEMEMEPAFQPDITEYNSSLFGSGKDREPYYIWPVAADSKATVKVTAVYGVDGVRSGQEITPATAAFDDQIRARYKVRPLSETDPARICITVTAEDGVTTRSYYINLYRNNDWPEFTIDRENVTNRTADSVTLRIHANIDGYLYYLPAYRGAYADIPAANEVKSQGQRIAIHAGDQVVTIPGLGKEECTLYLYEMSYAQRFSNGAQLDIAAYTGGDNPPDPVTPTPGDLNQDGKIDMTDLSWILDALTAGRSVDQTMGDLNGDHVVDMTDAAILMDQITAAL